MGNLSGVGDLCDLGNMDCLGGLCGIDGLGHLAAGGNICLKNGFFSRDLVYGCLFLVLPNESEMD